MKSTNKERTTSTQQQILPGRRALRRSMMAWKQAAVALLVLAVLCNVAQGLIYRHMQGQWQTTIQRAEESRDDAIQELAALSLATAQEKQARAAQAEAYAAMGDWEYIGECKITAYCCEPYPHICGTRGRPDGYRDPRYTWHCRR